ncbi:MAG: hypothetical protein ACLPKB_20280 [Xanthobacteraceae bacterium]
MSVLLQAMARHIWTKCQTPAVADHPHGVGDGGVGTVAMPLPSLPTPFEEGRDPFFDPPLRQSEKTEPSSGTPAAETAAVQNPADAEQLVVHLTQVMDCLLAVVEEETQLIRAGRADIPDRVEQSKADLARRYSADITRLQRNRLYLRQMLPVSFAVLHHRHKNFGALLQINLTLLAAERAAAEAPAGDLAADSSRASGTPHRPRPLRAHLPRLPQARCCPLPRRLQQTRHTVRAQPAEPEHAPARSPASKD